MIIVPPTLKKGTSKILKSIAANDVLRAQAAK